MEKRWCFGKMDLLITEDCTDCEDMKDCWDLSFEAVEHVRSERLK